MAQYYEAKEIREKLAESSMPQTQAGYSLGIENALEYISKFTELAINDLNILFSPFILFFHSREEKSFVSVSCNRHTKEQFLLRRVNYKTYLLLCK